MASKPTSNPSEQTLESLSAFVDGEASAFESRRIVEMASDSAISGKWRRYHLSGALMRKEYNASVFKDLSAGISEALDQESSLRVESVASPLTGGQTANASEAVINRSTKSKRWKDAFAKSAIAASVAFAVIAGVQFTQNGPTGLVPNEVVDASDPVIAAPVGFDLPSPVARNVSLGNLAEPQRKIQSAVPAKKQFLSNAEVEAELQQLFLDHAQLSAENGKFGLMPMARAAKMVPAK